MRIAIIGSGIAGLTVAHRLHARHRISVFERRPRIGGHVHTVTAKLLGKVYRVDTGFIVYSEGTFSKFLAPPTAAGSTHPGVGAVVGRAGGVSPLNRNELQRPP